jgi:hypothetical protein
MRIWDIEPKYLCRYHLLGEHRELHALWNIITLSKSGYRNHPENKRWRGKLAALYKRHELLVAEMGQRGYKHSSPLDQKLAKGDEHQTVYLNTIEEQLSILKAKPCPCLLS